MCASQFPSINLLEFVFVTLVHLFHIYQLVVYVTQWYVLYSQIDNLVSSSWYQSSRFMLPVIIRHSNTNILLIRPPKTSRLLDFLNRSSKISITLKSFVWQLQTWPCEGRSSFVLSSSCSIRLDHTSGRLDGCSLPLIIVTPSRISTGRLLLKGAPHLSLSVMIWTHDLTLYGSSPCH